MKKSYNDSGLTAKRSYRLLTAGLTAILMAVSGANAQDYARMGERTIMGTARYVGMSGAMSAIGADPSATLDNVAGLGLYRHSEVLVSFDFMSDRAWQVRPGSAAGRARLFMAPQASLVLSFPTNQISGIQYHNIQISYQRLHTFNRALTASALNGPSLGALFVNKTAYEVLQIPFCSDRTSSEERMDLIESGYVNEYAIDWSMNISDRWYVGAGLHINSFSMSSEGRYQEWFDEHHSPKGATYFNYSETRVLYDGVGASLAVGAIYRPVQWFRLGFGLETPSVSSFRIAYSGAFQAQTDTLGWAPDSRDRTEPTDFHMPLHLSTSAAFQITNYALIALQYDYFHQPGEIDRHSLRAGVEVTPYPGLYLNAGYAYESPFRSKFPDVAIDPSLGRQDTYYLRQRRSQYISGAIGYRGRYFLVQAAYQYRMQRINLWAHEMVNEPYEINTNTHRIVVTLGWHR